MTQGTARALKARGSIKFTPRFLQRLFARGSKVKTICFLNGCSRFEADGVCLDIPVFRKTRYPNGRDIRERSNVASIQEFLLEYLNVAA